MKTQTYLRTFRGAAPLFLSAALILFARAPVCADDAKSVDLLKRARFVARIRNWYGQGGHLGHHGLHIHWLSDTQLLHTRFDAGQQELPTAYRLDIRTGHDTPMPRLTRAINDFDPMSIDDEKLSPNGKWLVRSARWEGYGVMEVNGPHHYEKASGDGDGYRSIFWLPDGNCWIERIRHNEKTKRLILHDVRDPDLTRNLSIGDKDDLFTSIEHVFSLDRAIALVEPYRDMGVGDRNQSVETYELSLDARKKPRKIGSIPVPRGSGEFECRLSPKGDRIAWQVTIRTDGGTIRTEIWVCATNRSGMRCLGTLLSREHEDHSAAPYIDLTWLPSGQSVAFEWKGLLYTVSIAAGNRGWRPAHVNKTKQPHGRGE